MLDCVNGAGGVITPLLLDQLGCDYKVINGEPSGLFPRNPEPVPENLKELEKVTAAFGADVGFAHDPDVDRLAIVSEKGRAIGEEYTLALAVMNAAEKGNGTVVTNMSTSSLTEYAAEKNNCSMIRTAVGEVNVAEKMMDQGALIGGEGNGGVIDPRLHLTRDAPMAVALVLEYLARHDISVEEAVSMFPVFSMIKEKQSFEDLETRRKAMEKISKEIISSGVSYDDTDGIRYEFQDGWVHVRQSGTEPVIRYIGEGRSEKAVREEILRLRKLV